MNRAAPKVTISALPPAETATWYGWTKPCTGCKATILKRRETDWGPEIVVRHQPSCGAC